MKRRAEFIGFVLAAVATAVLLGVIALSLDSESPTRTLARGLSETVYRSSAKTPTTAAPDQGPSVIVLPGILHEPSPRTRGLEAALRLHTWLALRDIHATGPELVWDPAQTDGEVPEPMTARCLPDRLPARRTLGRDDPPLLGPGLVPRSALRVFLEVSTEPGLTRFEARACPPGSGGSSQVFQAESGQEGPALRELMAWLTVVVGTTDPEPWFESWGRPIAPDQGPLRAYGEALIASMQQEGDLLPPALLSAGSLLPEAAWLGAALAPRPEDRRMLLQRAAALRPGFTAALEDLAWEWLRAGRPDLARMTLARLDPFAAARPSELLLAARLLDEGHAADAARLLAELPEPWSETTAARRLEARARLASGDYDGARAAARAWTDAASDTTEGWLLQGDAEQGLGRFEAAQSAYEQALSRPSRLRADALVRWSLLMLRAGEAEAVRARLSERDDASLVTGSPALLALRSWSSFQTGAASAAADDARLLVEQAPTDTHRRNLCVLELAAGSSDAPPERCGSAVYPDLFGTLMDAVWLSRRPFRTPEQGGQLDRAVVALAEAAPLSPVAAGAALRVLGPREEDEELRELQAHWRVALGATPQGPLEPTGPLSGSSRTPPPR